MPASEQISRLAPYARRLLDDDSLQEQFDRLFTNLRDGSQRARRKGAAEAATDRKLRTQLTAALAAAGHIARALNEPEPKPSKRHGIRTLTLTVALAGAAFVGYRQLSSEDSAWADAEFARPG
jgi:hypothetical protein